MVQQNNRIDLAAFKYVEKLLLGVRLPTQCLVIDAVNPLQQILMDRVRPLVRGDEFPSQVLRLLYRTIGAHENTVPFAGRFPFRAKTDDGRAVEFPPQEIWQVKIRHLDVAADQRVLLFMARRIRQLDDF